MIQQAATLLVASGLASFNAGGVNEGEDGTDKRADTFEGHAVKTFGYSFHTGSFKTKQSLTVASDVTADAVEVKSEYHAARLSSTLRSTNGAVLTQTQADTTVLKNTVDVFGRVLTSRTGDNDQNDTKYTYDDTKSGTGLVETVRRPGGESLDFKYDSAGNRVMQSSNQYASDLGLREWQYDALGRVVTDKIRIDPDNTTREETRHWKYRGNRTIYTDRDLRRITTTFDPVSRRTVSKSDTPFEGKYGFETTSVAHPNGQVFTVTDTTTKGIAPSSDQQADLAPAESSTVTTIWYDTLGRPISESTDLMLFGRVVDTWRVDTELTTGGSADFVTHWFGDTKVGTTDFSIDSLNRTDGIVVESFSAKDWVNPLVDKDVPDAVKSTFTFNVDMGLASISRSERVEVDDVLQFVDRGISLYQFHADGRIKKIEHEDASGEVGWSSILHNPQNQLYTKEDVLFKEDGSRYVHEAETYSYYHDGQLKSVTRNNVLDDEDPVTLTWGYDDRGNVESETNGEETTYAGQALGDNRVYEETVGVLDRVIKYDDEGRVIEREAFNDEGGSHSKQEYKWDPRGRLLEVRQTWAGVSTEIVKFSYDGRGRLVGQTQSLNSHGHERVSGFVYDTSGLAFELNVGQQSEVDLLKTKIARRFVNGPGRPCGGRADLRLVRSGSNHAEKPLGVYRPSRHRPSLL